MIQFVIGAAIWAGIQLYNYLTRPHQPAPIPRTAGSLDLPRTEEGSAIPLVYGRTQVKSGVLVWMSQLNTKMGPDDQYITYGLYLLFVVGLPMGNGVTHGNSLNGPLLHNVWLGDRALPSPGTLPRAGSVIEYAKQVFQPAQLGGPGRGGGLIGSYQWFGGWTDQSFVSPASPIGDAMQGSIAANQIPGHRGMMCVSFQYAPESSSPYFAQTQGDGTGGTTSAFPLPDGFVLGENPDVNGFAFEVSSYGDKIFSMVTPGFDFGGDADPMEVIYDLLTNPWGRVGLDVSKIDMPSWLACSNTLKAEGHGYSGAVYDSQDAREVINAVCAQIDCSIYEEPTTGKFMAKLVRQDYDPSLIPLFDESNIIEVSDYTLGSWRDTINEVRVRFTNRSSVAIGNSDPSLYNVQTAVASSLANAVGNSNRRRPKQIDYLGISNLKIASQVAARDLNVLSTPLGKISFTVNRDGWMIRPAQVFKVSFAEYGLNQVVFRATRVDLGKLEDGKITIDAVQDAFETAYVGSASGAANPNPGPTALAIRNVVECPRWLQTEAALAGLINDPDYTRILALPVPGSGDVEYYVNSQQPDAQVAVFRMLLQDIPRQTFPTRMQVVTAYPRNLEPYDTSTGLVVGNITGPGVTTFGVFPVTAADIQNHGKNLLCIMRANGEHEFVAFESATSLGGGQLRLNNVWRGLMDTPAIDHSVGEYAFVIEPSMVGRRAWSIVKPVKVQTVPSTGPNTGTTSDIVEYLPNVGPIMNPWLLTSNIPVGFVARPFRPMPVANLALIGDGCFGTTGVPNVAGNYKVVSLLDEDFELASLKRELRVAALRRGDAVDDTLNTTFGSYDWALSAFPTGKWKPAWSNNNYVGISAAINSTNSPAINAHYLAGAQITMDWYGSVDVGILSKTSILSANPAVGKGGLEFGQQLTSFADPRITCYAPSWRNLVANPRWAISTLSSIGSGPSPWISFSALALGGVPSFSLSRNGTYLIPQAASMLIQQVPKVASFNSRGLTAFGVGYIRNGNSDTNDTGHLDVGDGTTTTAGTTTVGPNNNWQRVATSMTIGATTQTPSVQLNSTEVAGTGTTFADTCWDEIELHVGQFQANVLTNYSFESSFTGWTNITNSFVNATAIASPSATYAQGGAFSASTIRQEYTPPSGWTVGAQAFVSLFVASTLASDTSQVTISAIDGGGATLASQSLTFSFSILNVWAKRTLFCDMPDGTVKIRVDLTANRTLGSGNSGACFDEVALWVAKDQMPRYRKNLDFSQPTTQQMPRTLAEFELAYPSEPIPAYVFGGTNANSAELVWTDQAAHAVAKFTGQFGGVSIVDGGRTSSLGLIRRVNVASYGSSVVDGYTFARASGAAATHLAAQHRAYTIGQYPLTQSFTAAIIYAIDEQGFAAQCGLVGRMDLGQGWGLELDASGHLTALLRGGGGTSKTVSLGRVSSEGGRHFAALVYDAIGGTLTVYDELGSAAVSTAGLGEINGTSSACHLRIGRDADDRDVMPGMVARVYIWGSALTSGQVTALWNYGLDPNGLITTYTRSAAAWCTGVPDSAGEILYCAGPTQIAMPWHTALTVDDFDTTHGGFLNSETVLTPSYIQTYTTSGYGLAIGRAVSNRIQGWDFTNASVWVPDASTVLTQGIVDPSGRARGVTIAGNATNGIKTIGVTVGAVARQVNFSFWARGTPGAGNLTVECLTGAGALVFSRTFTLTALWQRFNAGGAFSGATATCQWRIRSTSGSLTFDLGSVTWSSEWTTSAGSFPHLIPGPASSLNDINVTAATTLPIEFNSEGEIVVTGSTLFTDPVHLTSPATATLVRVKNGTNTKNTREVQMLDNLTAQLAHTDGAASPATVNSNVLIPNTWLTTNKVRGRWNLIGMPDANAPMFAQVTVADTGNINALGGAGRILTWTNDTTQSTEIDIGFGTAAPEPMLLTSVVVQAREEKLP